MKYTIPVVVRVNDNQDGGFGIYVYNNMDDMLADHPNSEDGPLSDEERKAIVDGDDEYENGVVSHDEIEVTVIGGKTTLSKPLHFHAGQ